MGDSEEEELHPNDDEKDEISELVESIKDSEHKHILSKGAKRPFGSFYTSKHPGLIFEHLWGYLASKGYDCEINANNLCLDFAVKQSEYGEKMPEACADFPEEVQMAEKMTKI